MALYTGALKRGFHRALRSYTTLVGPKNIEKSKRPTKRPIDQKTDRQKFKNLLGPAKKA